MTIQYAISNKKPYGHGYYHTFLITSISLTGWVTPDLVGIGTPTALANTITIQESAPGFCLVDGAIDSNNSGFTGSGFANTENANGKSIQWRISGDAGSYKVRWRFANGGSSNRSGVFSVDNSRLSTRSFAGTGGWTAWTTTSVDVELKAGNKTLILTANQSEGLANIDYVEVTGPNVAAASCSANNDGGDDDDDDDSGSGDDNNQSSLVTGCGTETSNLKAKRVYYVTPTASDSGSGQSFNQPMSFSSALSAVKADQMVLLQPGTYTIPYRSGRKNTIKLSKSGKRNAPIYMVAANCGRAVIDFSFPDNTWVQNAYGFHVTGDYWYFKGIDVTRAGYQGTYVEGAHNTFEHCRFYDNRNTGLEINKGGSHTTVINSDAFNNYDPKKNGSMADGFAPKQKQGPGNRFYGCRAWNNSDDGFDTFDSPQKVIIEHSWAFENGIDIWGYGNFSGNGNGFKLGGNRAVQRNRITNSVAFGNRVKGFDQNNNNGGITLLNNTAYKNGINFGFCSGVRSGQRHYMRNNVSIGARNDICDADARNNTFDSGPSASARDFESVNLSRARQDRNPDGTIRNNGLFRLRSGSRLINAGAKVGLPYKGSAPDLGAFER